MIAKGKCAEIFGKGAATPQYLRTAEGIAKKREALKFLGELRGYGGEYAANMLGEALTTSDFSNLLTSNMGDKLLNDWRKAPVGYKLWTYEDRSSTFNTHALIGVEGSAGYIQEVDERTGVHVGTFGDSKYNIQLKEYAEIVGITRKMIINDVLGGFNKLPGILADKMARTCEHLATQKIADVNGPDATLFTQGHGNLITSELTMAGVEEAVEAMYAMADATTGDTIVVDPKYIIVPPNLKLRAQKIVKALQVRTVDYGATTALKGYDITTDNPFANLEVVENNEITKISTSNTYKTKQWYLASDPNVGRPAVARTVNSANPEPRLMRSTPDAEIIGGGMDTFSFLYQKIDYKVHHDFGVAQVDYHGMVGAKPTS